LREPRSIVPARNALFAKFGGKVRCYPARPGPASGHFWSRASGMIEGPCYSLRPAPQTVDNLVAGARLGIICKELEVLARRCSPTL